VRFTSGESGRGRRRGLYAPTCRPGQRDTTRCGAGRRGRSRWGRPRRWWSRLWPRLSGGPLRERQPAWRPGVSTRQTGRNVDASDRPATGSAVVTRLFAGPGPDGAFAVSAAAASFTSDVADQRHDACELVTTDHANTSRVAFSGDPPRSRGRQAARALSTFVRFAVSSVGTGWGRKNHPRYRPGVS
jgi:hypothetical protein